MTTENHELNTPAEGTASWDEPLNENFRRIDTEVEIRDTEDNLGQYTPKSGAKFLATDTGTRYLGDGSQWKEAPVHLPDILDAPEYSEENPVDPSVGELWYRSDLDTLVGQFQDGIVNLMTGEILSGDGSGDDSSDDDTTDTTNHTLEILPADGADWDNYSAVVDGTITNTQNLNSGDTITEQSDGTLLIEGGIMGGKDPEVYEFDGELLSLSLEVDATAYLDGQAIDQANY